jgi:beta-glucosidase
MILVLNVGNIIDMGFEDTCQPDAVLYAWQGGMDGGLGTADVLTGAVNPSGRLTDTIAYAIEDYPSDRNFGKSEKELYEEDIYVGYRYFETAAKEKVRYPFGFGLSYTVFSREITDFQVQKDGVALQVNVKNEGKLAGKEVVQIYVNAPQGLLGKPEMVLVDFKKTTELAPGNDQKLAFFIPYDTMASYDETGVSGFASSYVLEKGRYHIYAGSNVREISEAGSFIIEETRQIKALSQALAPVTPFRRMKPETQEDGKLVFRMEEVPLRKLSPAEKRKAASLPELPYTGDKGYKLADVKAGTVSMETFIAQLSDDDLSCIIRGEGMGSPKVTPGTAAAFGGVSDTLKALGIPCGCCSDGPSGMRLDSGMKAFSLPNGTLLACTFHPELVEELYSFTGIEMVKNRVDALLGPGMNIHRHPLNGRNFEYFSEDPLVTGKTAAAMIRGMQKAGVTGTAKHFCGNNREKMRHSIDSVVSERALREIYLKGFEIAVKEGGADSIMTTYGSVNGLWTAGSYDLNTTILRGEWGFEGIVMTDWWAKINEEGKAPASNNFAAMAAAQNDIYMVCSNASVNDTEDNTLSSLEAGTLSRAELQRNAMNICRFLLHTHAFDRMQQITAEVEVLGDEDAADSQNQEIVYYKVEEELAISMEGVDTDKGMSFVFALDLEKLGGYRVQLTAKSDLSELAQTAATLQYQGVPKATYTYNGTGGSYKTIEKKVVLFTKYAQMRLYFAQSGLQVKEIRFIYDKPMGEITDHDAYINS